MPRFSVTLDDSVLNQVDSNARKKQLSRSGYIADAIESSLHQTGSELDQCESRLHQCESDLNQRDSELNQSRQSIAELENKLMNQIAEKDKIIESITIGLNQAMNQVVEKDKIIESVDIEVTQLKLQIDKAVDLKNDFDQLKTRYDQSLTEATQRWEELKGYKSDVTKLKKLLDESQAIILHLKDDLLKRQSETDQLAKTGEELALAKMEADKLKEAIKVRDDDIAFLRGHLSQLSEKLPKSLPPSQEEAKKRGWWQFWK
jgi:metal-responsive CopG/Arc/MetJ family transcriptional regulator